MTTDQLINLLVADLKPVDRACISRALIIALAGGAVSAFGVMFLLLGPHPSVFSSENSGFLIVKLLFTSGVVAAAAVFLPQFARPGAEGRCFMVFVSAPFIAMAVLASMAFAFSHWSTWGKMAIGNTWLTCLHAIPLLAIVPFVAVVLALRTGAPTDQTRDRKSTRLNSSH